MQTIILLIVCLRDRRDMIISKMQCIQNSSLRHSAGLIDIKQVHYTLLLFKNMKLYFSMNITN